MDYIPSNVNVQNALGAYHMHEELVNPEMTLYSVNVLHFYNDVKVMREFYTPETVAYKLIDKDGNFNIYAVVDKVRKIIYNVRSYTLYSDIFYTEFKDKPHVLAMDFIRETNESFAFIKRLIVAEDLTDYKVYFYTPFDPFYNPKTEIVLDIIERW